MKKYMIYAKTNTDYASGMITKPQNRFDPASKLGSQFNTSEPMEFLFTNGDHFNFITIFTALDDESVSAIKLLKKRPTTKNKEFYTLFRRLIKKRIPIM